MTTFKFAVLLSLIFFSSHIYAQSSKTTPLEITANDEIKIDLTENTISATFQNKALPVSTIAQLDSYLKSNSDLGIHKALVITIDKVDPERSRSLSVALGKNIIHSVRSFTRFKTETVASQSFQ